MGESRRRRGEKWRMKNTDKNKLKCCSYTVATVFVPLYYQDVPPVDDSS